MADVYFIDGQALEPTAFARELTTGQWVPREVDFTPAEIRLSDGMFISATNSPPDVNTTTPTPAISAARGFDGNSQPIRIQVATLLLLMVLKSGDLQLLLKMSLALELPVALSINGWVNGVDRVGTVISGEYKRVLLTDQP